MHTVIFDSPSSLAHIGRSAFVECKKLQSISIPSTVTTLSVHAFQKCISLRSLVFEAPSSLTVLESYAFGFCYSLTSVTIPETVKTLNISAFGFNKGLKSVISLIKEPSYMQYDVFTALDKTKCALVIPPGTTDLYKSAGLWGSFTSVFELMSEGDSIEKDGLQYTIDELVLSEFGSQVTLTGAASFQGTMLPAEINYGGLNYDVVAIGDSVFETNTLSSPLVIPNKVKSIGSYAFNTSKRLTHLRLPASLTSIGKNAFGACNCLWSITVDAATPPVLGADVFLQVDKSDCVLYVPFTSLEAYKSAPQWGDFATILAWDASDVTFPDSSPVKLYPGRVTDLVTLGPDVDTRYQQLVVYSVTGVKVMEHKPESSIVTLDLSRLSSGVYLMHCVAGDGKPGKTLRFLKE